MSQSLETFILLVNITKHEVSPIDKLDSSINNGQSLVSTCDAVFVGNGRFFCFNENVKLYLHVIVGKKCLVLT